MSKSHTGKKLSKEWVEKIRKANIGRKKFQEEKDKISIGNKGRIRTQENKDKIKQSLLNLKLPKNNIAVLMLDENDNIIEEFSNTKSINKIKGWETRHIRKILKRGYGTSKGFKWKYKHNHVII